MRHKTTFFGVVLALALFALDPVFGSEPSGVLNVSDVQLAMAAINASGIACAYAGQDQRLAVYCEIVKYGQPTANKLMEIHKSLSSEKDRSKK